MVTLFEVGGCVRDELLGKESNDVDFACVAESFDSLVKFLENEGFDMFQVRPEFVTVRAGVPIGNPLSARTKVADFVLCRKDGTSSDGRRPDFVEPGTLLDDLARRDFTVNAIAKDVVTGEIIDPFDGVNDLAARKLRFVGNGADRVNEDGLRVLRAFRFMVTKNLTPTAETMDVLTSKDSARMLASVSTERIREELEKMFAFDTVATLELFSTLPKFTVNMMFPAGLRLSATMRK